LMSAVLKFATTGFEWELCCATDYRAVWVAWFLAASRPDIKWTQPMACPNKYQATKSVFQLGLLYAIPRMYYHRPRVVELQILIR
jgi:hypothetical protein